MLFISTHFCQLNTAKGKASRPGSICTVNKQETSDIDVDAVSVYFKTITSPS